MSIKNIVTNRQIKEIINHIKDALPKKSNMLPDIIGPIKYPIAKHWESSAKAKPFLFVGAIPNTISEEVGKNDEVPMLQKIIDNNIMNTPYDKE